MDDYIPSGLGRLQVIDFKSRRHDLLRRCDSYQIMGELLNLYFEFLRTKRLPVFYACLGDVWQSSDNIASYKNELKFVLGGATRRELNLMMVLE